MSLFEHTFTPKQNNVFNSVLNTLFYIPKVRTFDM